MMCTGSATSNKLKTEPKPSLIIRGMASNLAMRILICARYYFDSLVDFLASLVWDGQKEVLPLLDKRTKILAESATSMAAMIKNGELKARDLVEACIERIKLVNPVINAVTDERFEAAVQDAIAVDELIAKGLTDEEWRAKPFLGVPFTTKETHACKGMLYTLGTKSRRHIRASDDAETVRLMKEAGAILLATSNIPEFNMWQETRNMIYGQTVNPYHGGHTVGGSSGGEGALVASIASPIGLCSDIGGSTRMPAFYCGLFAYNPTPGYVNMRGALLRTGEETNSMVTASFLARDLCDLAPLTKVIAGKNAHKLNLDRTVDLQSIRFFYVEKTNDLRCTAMAEDLRRCMRKVVSKLSETVKTTDRAPREFYNEGFDFMFRLWKHEMTKEPTKFGNLLAKQCGSANGLAELFKKAVGLSNLTFAAILKLLDEQVLPAENPIWAEEKLSNLKNALMETLGSDGVLLFPSCTRPAPYHYTAFVRPYDFGHWAIFNALKFPVVQVPLGLNSDGLPLGIQVVATPHNDALCLEVAKYLEKAFGGYVPSCGRIE